jgi:hypothetical protein
MKPALSILVIVSLAVAATVTAGAEEGMWTLDQLKLLDLNRKGLEIPVDDVYRADGACLADAAVLLGGGTSAFVSPKGLLLTNHHVAYGAVQRASTQGTDYLTNGFLASTYAEEIQAPGVSAQIITEMRDVTDEVLKSVKGVKDVVKRQREIDKKIRKMTEKIEKGKVDVSAQIAAMYDGKQYVLYIYKRFDDVRVVYMPPLAIGNYGGDVDNWMWPRHTGDFAFMRAYVSPDGVGAKYSEENVPYEPKTWLQVSTGDLDEGDFAFTLGFPGHTTRFRTSYSAAYWQDLYLPDRLQLFDDVMTALDGIAEQYPEAKMKLAGAQKGIANVQKNWGAMLESMKRSDFVNEKRAMERELTSFIDGSQEYKKKYGDVLSQVAVLYDGQRKVKRHDDVLGLFGYYAGLLPSVASRIVYYAEEREKPEKKRDPYFSEDDVEREVFRLDSRYLEYFEPAQEWQLGYVLNKAAALPDDERLVGLDYMLKDPSKSIDDWVDYILANTKLADKEHAKSLYTKSTRELKAMKDPLIDMALALYPEVEDNRDRDEEFGAKITNLRRKFSEALLLWKGGAVYPDANRTLRFSDGTIMGYRPRDAVSYYPFTRLEGVYEKDTGVEPFDMPPKLKDLYLAGDYGRWKDPELDDVPVAFLVDCDGTGGSSGSPVLNSKGEMIGIAFDGVIEARLGDWKFEPAVAREICVDIRYVLFVTEKFAGADYLLKELGVAM